MVIVGYDPRHGRFRCMHTRIGTKREQIMFDLPVEVARASFDVRLMWAVEAWAGAIERLRPRRGANHTPARTKSGSRKTR